MFRKVSVALTLVGALIVSFILTTRSTLSLASGSKPQDRFRVMVDDVLTEDQSVVTRIVVESRPDLWVRVGPDGDTGGMKVTSGSRSKATDNSETSLIILGDHVSKKEANAVRFLMKLKSTDASTKMTTTVSMRDGEKLSDRLQILIKPGFYPYDTPVPLLQFQGEDYGLTIGRQID